jgi:hypothetical protein
VKGGISQSLSKCGKRKTYGGLNGTRDVLPIFSNGSDAIRARTAFPIRLAPFLYLYSPIHSILCSRFENNHPRLRFGVLRFEGKIKQEEGKREKRAWLVDSLGVRTSMRREKHKPAELPNREATKRGSERENALAGEALPSSNRARILICSSRKPSGETRACDRIRETKGFTHLSSRPSPSPLFLAPSLDLSKWMQRTLRAAISLPLALGQPKILVRLKTVKTSFRATAS